jgi:hypothetical protein
MVDQTEQHGRGPLPYWTLVATTVVAFLWWYASAHDVKPGTAELISMVTLGMVITSIMDVLEWWRGE